MSQAESPRDADASDIEIESIQSKLPNWIILFTSLSFSLAILGEAISSKGFMTFLRIAIEIILIAGITFSQEKTMTDIRFRLKKLFAINITMWIFGKIVFYSGKIILEGDSMYRGYCFFLISQVIYHMGEFYFTVTCHINLLSWDSFLINHSKAYGIAQVACHSEFWIEVYFFPTLKDHLWIIALGVIMSAVGHTLRIGAFMTARSNFTHLIQHEKRTTHQLVTHGIYSISRHPSYLGWFLSTAGGQLLLINPICFVGFTLAAWYFFYDRILYEEYTLYKFFGNDYLEYMKKTPIRIPLLQHFIDRARRKNS